MVKISLYCIFFFLFTFCKISISKQVGKMTWIDSHCRVANWAGRCDASIKYELRIKIMNWLIKNLDFLESTMQNKIATIALIASTFFSVFPAQAKDSTLLALPGGVSRVTVSASFSPSTVAAGQTVTFSWSASGATSCEVGGVPGLDSIGVAGSYSFTASTSLNAGVYCENDIYGGSKSANLTVTSPTVPTVSVSYSPAVIDLGQSTTLSWVSSGANDCSSATTSSGGTSGEVVATSGSMVLSPNSNQTTSITCANAVGSTSNSASVTVHLIPPSLSFYANPNQLWGAGWTTLYWEAWRATSCSWGGTSGAVSAFVPQTTYYLNTCYGPGGSTTGLVVVNVNYLIAGVAGQEVGYLVQDSDPKQANTALAMTPAAYDLSHLGLDLNKKGVSFVASDLNGDGIKDLIVVDAGERVAHILVGGKDGFARINKRVKGVARLQDIKSVFIPDGKGSEITLTIDH